MATDQVITVNVLLKRQLAYVYGGLCNDDSSLDITMLLQQRQRECQTAALLLLQILLHQQLDLIHPLSTRINPKRTIIC